MIHFVIPGLPPSSNHAYFNLPRGGRALTAEGKKYKNETKVYLTQKYTKELLKFHNNSPYLVYLRFHLAQIENASWGKPKGAESRYKKIDASNRAKLLEDVLKDVSGVDDSNTLTLILEKRPLTGQLEERTEVFIWELEREESPFDAVIFEL